MVRKKATRGDIFILIESKYRLRFRSFSALVIWAKLWARLWLHAHRNGITVVLSTMPFTARNWNASRRRGNTLAFADHDIQVVFLAPGFWSNPFILAHEIGHLKARRGNDDDIHVAEPAADKHAVRLIRSLLSKEDFEEVKLDVDRFLVDRFLSRDSP